MHRLYIPCRKRNPAKSEDLQWYEAGHKLNFGLTVDGKPAALDESNADAKTYSQGLYVFIIYQSGKIAVMQDGKFLGYAK